MGCVIFVLFLVDFFLPLFLFCSCFVYLFLVVLSEMKIDKSRSQGKTKYNSFAGMPYILINTRQDSFTFSTVDRGRHRPGQCELTPVSVSSMEK